MPPEPPPDPSEPPSGASESEVPLGLPASVHPMHGLYHPSQFMFAGMMAAERQRTEYLPHPLAAEHWDQWFAHFLQNVEEQRKAEAPPSWQNSPSSSRRSSQASSHWGSEAAAPKDPEDPAGPPVPFPTTPITVPAASGDAPPAVYGVPPPLPLCTSRLMSELSPDNQTVTYGSNAEYYGGSNLETVTSMDLIPWYVKRQRQCQRSLRGGLKRRETLLEGRGSKRHMIIFERLPEGSGNNEGENVHDDDDNSRGSRRSKRRGSDAS